MSFQQKLFEGPVLEDLLATIRAEFGPKANIVRAERTYKGGVGGFFAREHFRLSVEGIPRAECSTENDPAEATDGIRTTYLPESPGRSAGFAADEISAFAALAESTSDVIALGEELAEPASSHLARPSGSAPVSASGSKATVRSSLPVSARLTAPNTQVDPLSATRGNSSTATMKAPGAETCDEPGPRNFDEALRQVVKSLGVENRLVDNSFDYDLDSPTSVPDICEEEGPTVHGAGASLALEEPGASNPLVTAVDAPALVQEARAAVPAAPALPCRTRRVASYDSAEQAQGPRARGLGAGLPQDLLDDAISRLKDGRRLKSALTEVLARLPVRAPLPSASDGVVAVVGRVDLLVPALETITSELGVDPRKALFVTPARGKRQREAPFFELARCDPKEAVRNVRQESNGAPSVVGVVAGLDKEDWSSASEVIGVMRPTAVLGVVDAAGKPEDIAAWAAGLGGLDALMLCGVRGTLTPAAVLNLDIPVGWLDGNPASPARWAAIIVDALLI